MIRLTLVLLMILATSSQAGANWRVYLQNDEVIASYDYVTFAPFRKQPSVWVKWYNVSQKTKQGGIKLQFTANCADHKLFEINSIPFDHNGNFLGESPSYDSPKEFPLDHNALNEATYKLLCR